MWFSEHFHVSSRDPPRTRQGGQEVWAATSPGAGCFPCPPFTGKQTGLGVAPLCLPRPPSPLATEKFTASHAPGRRRWLIEFLKIGIISVKTRCPPTGGPGPSTPPQPAQRPRSLSRVPAFLPALAAQLLPWVALGAVLHVTERWRLGPFVAYLLCL